MNLSGKKIALVHDFLVQYGGAERVFEALSRMFPDAPIYTLLYDAKQMEKHFLGRDIRVSSLSRWPAFLRRRYRFLLPFFPSAVEALDLREFDLVISSSGAWSKGIVTRLNTHHIAYIHSPMRYAWDYHEKYLEELGAKGKRKMLIRFLLSYLRIWDREAAERPDCLIANSRYTQERIKKYYQREAKVVYPGARQLFETFGHTEDSSETKKEYFLVVSRLTPSKKVGIVVEAFNKIGLPLVIVGSGPERRSLERDAKKNIRFVGFQSDEELARLYLGARALIFPSEEDFGMTAVEALSFGVPVIAFEYGGIREIVEPGVSGEFFHAQTTEVLAEGVRRFLVREGSYDKELLRKKAEQFSTTSFTESFLKALEACF